MEITFSVNIFRHFYDVLISTIGWGDTGQLIRFENIVNRYEMGWRGAGGLIESEGYEIKKGVGRKVLLYLEITLTVPLNLKLRIQSLLTLEITPTVPLTCNFFSD